MRGQMWAMVGRAVCLAICLLGGLTVGKTAFALDPKNDGLYRIDVNETKGSEHFQKFLKKNSMGELSLQMASQLLEYVRIRKDVMRIYSAECRIRDEGAVIRGDCVDTITEKKVAPVEIMFEGDMLVFLADDYPMYYRRQ
jgi:hypothetical protein